MLGPRLARRIVLPLLGLIAALFGVLAVVAAHIAEDRVTQELEAKADRVARTLATLPGTPRPEIVEALARLVGTELVVDGQPTRADWDADAVAGLRAGDATLGGTDYRVLARERCFVLVTQDEISRRRADVLGPVAAAGAVGLLVALLLGVLVARAIARPVKALADSVQGVAQGDFDVRVGPPGPGEIGDLQQAFVRMVEEVAASEAKLRESERFAALGRLAGGIAHELRNPLTAIRMAVETATAGTDQSRAEARRVALAEIDRLDRTLRELLDYVRPRQPRKAAVAVSDMFGEVAALLGPQCDHLNVRLEVGDANGVVVQADPDRLKQALLNLVLNGAQAQPRGGVVRLSTRDGGIEVADEGPGIPDEVKASLWQPFVTTKAAGIGLGLAVVRQVADEHGASLTFRTGPGGTTFRLEFV